ncbi:MAG: hypothetical protein K0R39_588 [Symbiobacteriaceae bacterium]|jgi:hypothetical protein|nr:hypothetical protein [Symbiobacteriaceae bacterium]
MRTYIRSELQRYRSRQQCLSTPADSVEQAVTRMLGCRGAEGSTPYLSLFWRVNGFAPAQFDKAVHEARSLLRVRGPRGTYYWVTPELAPLFLAAARTESHAEFLCAWGVPEGEYQAIAAEIAAAVAGQPPAVGELKRRLPAGLQRPVHRKGFPVGTALAVALEAMQLSGQVTLIKEPGFARHRSSEYYGDARDVTRPNLVALVSEWYPGVPLEPRDPAELRRDLVRAYIQTFGPVTVDDIVWWTGWTKREVRDHLRSCAGELAEVSVEGLAGTFLVHGPTWDPTDAPGAPPALCLLPGGDSLMKGYSGFDRFLGETAHDHNVLRFMPPVLADGLGLGNWGYRYTGDTAEVVVELFDQPDGVLAERITAAAARVGQLITGTSAPVRVRMQQRTDRWNPRASFPTPP